MAEEKKDSATAVADPSAHGADAASVEEKAEAARVAQVGAALEKAGINTPAAGTDVPGESTDDATKKLPEDGSKLESKTDEAAVSTEQPAADADDSLALTPGQAEAQKRFGMTDEHVAALGDQAGPLLDSMQTKFTTKMAELGRLQQRLEAGKAGDKGAGDDAAGASESEADAAAKLAFTEDDLDADPETSVTPAVAKFNDMAKRVAALEKGVQARQADEQEATVDRFFTGLWRPGEKDGDEDVTDFPAFGKGKWSGLAEDSPEHAARTELLKEASMIRKGYAFSNQPLSMQDALQKALAIVAPDQMREVERKQLTKKIDKRRRTATHPPGERKPQAAELTDEQKRVESVRARGKASGFFK